MDSTDVESDSESICSLFEMFGDILINDKVKYWLYPIESDQWEILYKWIKKNNINVLTSICKDNIKKNDVVIIYHKNTTHNKRHLGHGIIGLAQVFADPDTNYKHKIFIDKRFQKIVVTLKVLTIHNRALKITELEPFIKDHKDYKSEIKFYDKYVFNSSEFLPLDNKFGINFVEGFTELSQKNYDPPSSIKKNKNVSIDSVPFTTPSTNSEDIDSQYNDSQYNDSQYNDSVNNDNTDDDSVNNDNTDDDSVDDDSVDDDSVDDDSVDDDSVDDDSVDNDNDSVDNEINNSIFTKINNKEIKKDNIKSKLSDIDNKKNSLSLSNNKKNSLSKNSNSSDDNTKNSSLSNNKKNSLSKNSNSSDGNKKNSLSEISNKNSISKNTKYDTDSNEKDKKKLINKDSENDNIRIAMIPIMICPCVKFAIPDVKNYYKKEDRETIVKYFKKHYLNCNDCDITNNNNKELSFYFEKADFDYDESDKYDKEIDDEIDSYQNCIPMFPDDDSKESVTPIIKIKYINKESCYRHCLLILWTI